MRLEASTWISTTISGVYHELARIEGFKLLLAYIQGQNEYGKNKIFLSRYVQFSTAMQLKVF